MSGNAVASAMLRSSARVPASSTPVAPPPTTVIDASSPRPPPLSRSRPAMIVSRSAIASWRVYSA